MGVMHRYIQKYGMKTVPIAPVQARKGADVVVAELDKLDLAAQFVIPMVDAVVEVANLLNFRLGKPSNDPTKRALWRDKFKQQEALRRAGLPTPDECFTSDVERAVQFAAAHSGDVVVKPCDSSGSDGVWLCQNESHIRTAFAKELGKMNKECSRNHFLIVVEALIGEEWVVNTVSLHGAHKVTDVWCGPPKSHVSERGCPAQFVYNMQFLAPDSERRRSVVEYTLAALDATGVRNGAGHTELVWVDRPLLFEVNVRPAGCLPRAPHHPDQLEALVESFCNPSNFLSLPTTPTSTSSGAVVFLRAPRKSFLSGSALSRFADLESFAFFDRRLTDASKPYTSRRVVKTTGLHTSPGVVVLQGKETVVLADTKKIRRLEETCAYTENNSENNPICWYGVWVLAHHGVLGICTIQ